MPHKPPPASYQIKRKQLSEEEDPPSSSSSSSTPLNTRLTSTNTTNTCVGAFERLGEDVLSHILQYVTKSDWVRICQRVSRMWRQQVLKQEFKVVLNSRDPKRSLMDDFNESIGVKSKPQSNFNWTKTKSLLKCEFIGRVVSLRLIEVSDKLFHLLADYSSSLSKLQHLNVEGNTLGVMGIIFLKQLGSSCENLTSLNLSRVEELDDNQALDILSSKLLANCKKLSFSKNGLSYMLKYLAEISQLSQLTHLELNNCGYCDYDDVLELFLQSKVNLQYLNLQRYDLLSVSNLFTSNSTSNLNSNTVIFNQLTKLDISHCNVTNQMLFDIILSPKLPNLTTLIATDIRQNDQISTSISSSGVVGYRNSSNLTELNMNFSCVHPVAEMIKFTPKLKKLSIWYLRSAGRWNSDKFQYDFKKLKDYSFLVHADSKLSQLEYLEITKTTGWIELVFNNSMFSNLKYLNCREDGILEARVVKLIEECVNLPKLERVNVEMVKHGNRKTRMTDKLFGAVPTPVEEEEVFKAFRKNPMFNSNQLKIENFSYESVYEKNNDSTWIYIQK